MGMWKRFASRLQGGIQPNLVLAQRVIDKMKKAAESFIEDETGEAMIGLIMPGDNTNGVPTIYVLDTISPDDDETVRHTFTFQQGDARQEDIFLWMQMNWQVQREKRQFNFSKGSSAKWDAPLRHVGDWHKQPGYMIQPSGGDLMTALEMIDDEDYGTDFLLVPIVTLDHPATTIEMDANVNYISVPMGDGTCMRVDFWYVDRTVQGFRPMSPAVYPNNQVPELVDKLPWYITQEDRYNTEISQLTGDELFTSPNIIWNVDGKLPLEICVMAGRMGTSQLIVFVTEWDYPTSAPRAYTMPFPHLKDGETMHDLFKRTWPNAQPAKNPPSWQWSPDKYLIDYMHALEDAMGVQRPPKKTQVEAAATGDPALNNETPVSKLPDETELLPASKVAEARARAEANLNTEEENENDD